MEGVNLMAYNLCSGANSFDKKLYSSIPGNVEYQPKSVVYSRKQNLFLVIFELSGAANEVVLYKENTDTRLANSKDSTVKGQDAAFIGLDDSQFAILDSDKIGLALYLLPGMSSKELDDKNKAALEENPTADLAADPAPTSSVKGPVHFMF